MNQKFHKFSFCARQQFVESSLSITTPTPTTPDFAQQAPLPLSVVDTSFEATKTATASAQPPMEIDPWDLFTPATVIAQVPTATAPIFPAQLLLAPAKEIATVTAPATPATIASKPPRTSDDYNFVLTVPELRRKAKAAGIKNFERMKKNQLLAVLDS